MNIQNLMSFSKGNTEASPSLAAATQFQSLRNGLDTPVASNTDTQPTTQTIDSTDATGEDFQTFLTLLTSQIRNQDPLAPLDSTQFVEQLATFSSLELQAEGNQTLDEIVGLLRLQSEE